MKKLKKNEYRCASCDGVFEKGWSDEEAIAEYNERFVYDRVPLSETDLVCDNCYKKMMVWLNEIGVIQNEEDR